MSNREKYTAILELDEKLTEAGIPHTIERIYEGWLICVPERYRCEGDAVQHQFSYGNRDNLIEVWGFDLAEPVGYLTADKALRYFVKWYEKKKVGDLND